MITEIFSELSLKYSLFLSLFSFVAIVIYNLAARIDRLERELRTAQKQISSITKPICVCKNNDFQRKSVCVCNFTDLQPVYNRIDSVESFCADTSDKLILTNNFLSSLLMGLFSYACSPRADQALSLHISGAFHGEAEEVLFIQEYLANNYPYPLVKFLTDTGAVNWNTDDESVKTIFKAPNLKNGQNEKVYNYLTKILKRRG